MKAYWMCVAFDETRHYNIADEDRPFVKAIRGVYLYNRNEVTHCCEITPSYDLVHTDDIVYVTSECPDDVREQLCEKYEHLGGEDIYVHCADVTAIPIGEFHKVFGEVPQGAEDTADAVREALCGNPLIC